jgi:hypothetical protein
MAGSSATADGCVPDGCYDITVGGGSWQSEVSWDLYENAGDTVALLSGGAPYTGQIAVGATGSCAIGCTDSLAVNYDASALVDDGSCMYPCLDNSVYVAVVTDYYGDECSWDITDASGAVVASGGPYGIGYNTISDSACIIDGCYSLNMYDSFGDGWATGQLGSVTLTDGAGGTYAAGQLLTGTSASFDFTVGTTLGCTDTAASNYDACANTDDGSCLYPCTDNDVTITVGGGSWDSEIGWSLVDGSGVTVASGGAPYSGTACLADDCYTMNMTDAFGDGWNGGTYSIDDNNTGTAYGTGGLTSGAAGSDLVSIGASCPVYGCTDSTAINYDPLATSDDGSCIAPVPCNTETFCDDFESGSFVAGNWLASSGSEAAAAVTMTNPNGTYSAEFQGGNYVGWTGGSSTTTSAQAWANLDHISQIDMCLDLSAVAGGPLNMVFDYNSQSYFGNGAYSWFRVLVDGVVVADANGNLDHYAPGSQTLQYDLSAYAGMNPNVTLQASCKYGDVYSGGAYNDYVWVDNLCIISAVPGCTDSNATNYDAAATQDDGSCTYSCAYLGLDEITINLYDSFGDGWNGNSLTVDGVNYTVNSGASASFTVCVDLSTCITATYNNTGSWASENSWDITDASGTVLISGGNIGSGGDFGNCGYAGCTDPTANNYDSGATSDDGSCTYDVYGCTDPLACNYDSTANVDDGSCNTVYGCMDATAFNYDSTATCSDPSSCIAIVYGCTDATALNYYAGANSDDGTCVYVAGCTDATACNYDPLADFDDGSCTLPDGCTDPLATNYDATALCNDGSCIYPSAGCTSDPITGLGVTTIIHNQATFIFDNMNTYDASGAQECRVDQLRIKYREVGSSTWSQKNMAAPTGYDPLTGICNSTQNTSKLVLGLTSGTTYEWEMRAWYCATGASAWVVGPNFTTLTDCPDVGNFAVTSPTTTKATFTWDDSNGAYSFVRVQARVDTTGSPFFNIGGVGVVYGTWTKDKNGLSPGTSYRAKSRTWCDPNGGAYKAPSWTSFIYWTQPTVIRLEGGTAINNLDVYPNPSRDVFNVTFTSEDAQDLGVRVLNVVGEVVYTENLEQFVGEN